MITLELSETDLEKLIRIGRELSGAAALDKLSNFRLLPGNRVAFDQHFLGLSTTVQLELSCEQDGNLLIGIPRLADNGVGNAFLKLLEKFLPDKFVSDQTNGILKKLSDRQFRLNLENCLPVEEKITIKNVKTSNRKLALDISIEQP